jgi:hypothetical protein
VAQHLTGKRKQQDSFHFYREIFMQNHDYQTKRYRRGWLQLTGLLMVLWLASVPVQARYFNINPFITCIEPLSDGSGFIANFGYESFESSLVQVLIGSDNFFSPNPEDRGQPVVFFPGYHERAFRVRYLTDPNNPSLIWNFLGNRVFANSGVKTCSGADQGVRRIVPFVERVTINSQTNQATATFGYFSNATQNVTLSVGALNQLSGTLTSSEHPTVFLPGLHRNVFSVTFSIGTDKAMFWMVEGWPALAVPGLSTGPLRNQVAPPAEGRAPK